VFAAILVCAAAYYGLTHFPQRHSAASPAPSAAVTTPTKPTPAPTPSVEAKPPVTSDKPSVDSVQAPPVAPSTTAPGTATPAPPTASAIQIALSANEPVWVTAIADGKTVVSQVLQPGSVKTIDAAQGVRITLGNAGGIDITFNGRKLEPFGPRGQVRTVDFTSWGAQVVSRTPPPNPDPLR
jgi:hypothetical protein